MPKDSKPTPLETKNDQPTPKLKLVVSNPAPAQKSPAISKSTRPTTGFYVEIQSKSPQVYEMKAQDPSHYLECDLKLEVMGECDEYEGGVICHFGNIADGQFNEFVEGDETLYGALMVEFQIKILTQLFLFCAEHDASGLIIYVDDDQAKALGAYEDFVVLQEQIILADIGEKTAMVIPAHLEAFDKWVHFMEDITQYFQETLWLEQRFNPVIRTYLKSNAALASS